MCMHVRIMLQWCILPWLVTVLVSVSCNGCLPYTIVISLAYFDWGLVSNMLEARSNKQGGLFHSHHIDLTRLQTG